MHYTTSICALQTQTQTQTALVAKTLLAVVKDVLQLVVLLDLASLAKDLILNNFV